MSRITNEDRIRTAWSHAAAQKWPPTLGDKLRLFQPKDLRGRVAKVIAVGDEKTKASTRLAPQNKARIQVKTAGGTPMQFAVGHFEVFPKEYTLKDLQNIL
jgi:hypothetical protein